MSMENGKETEKNAAEGQAAPSVPPKAAEGGGVLSSLEAELSATIEKLKAEKQEVYDHLLRKQAELENFRKRVQREKEDLVQHAAADLIRALLPTLDGLERALKHRDSSVPEPFYQGMELIHRELRETLGRAGLSAVEAEGKLFDPHLHQAVETVESDQHEDHQVIEEFQRGYKLRQRLLRPSIVKVAVKPKAPEAAAEKE